LVSAAFFGAFFFLVGLVSAAGFSPSGAFSPSVTAFFSVGPATVAGFFTVLAYRGAVAKIDDSATRLKIRRMVVSLSVLNSSQLGFCSACAARRNAAFTLAPMWEWGVPELSACAS
jgi:hypothetical protein